MEGFRLESLELRRGHADLPCCIAVATRDCLEPLQSSVSDFLHPDERLVYARFKVPKRAREFLLSRYAAKRAAANLLNSSELSKVKIAEGVFRQPFVQFPDAWVPEISLSHSGLNAVAVAAPPGHPVTVDLEELDESKTATLETALSRDEVAVALSKIDSKLIALLIVWTAKEALSKALRCGLTLPLEQLRIDEILSPKPDCFEVSYSDFIQYKALAFVMRRSVLTLVLPRKSSIGLRSPGSLFGSW